MTNLQISTKVVTFQSDLGWFGVVLTQTKLSELTFGHFDEFSALERLSISRNQESPDPPDWWQDSQNLLVNYAAGEPVDLSKIPLEDRSRTSFQQRIVAALRNVRYGETVSYAELARRAGSPKAARAVGNAMANNSLPIVIPCHRVIASGGRLGGFSAPQGLTMKRRLLAMEFGVESWDDSLLESSPAP